MDLCPGDACHRAAVDPPAAGAARGGAGVGRPAAGPEPTVCPLSLFFMLSTHSQTYVAHHYVSPACTTYPFCSPCPPPPCQHPCSQGFSIQFWPRWPKKKLKNARIKVKFGLISSVSPVGEGYPGAPPPPFSSSIFPSSVPATPSLGVRKRPLSQSAQNFIASELESLIC